MFKILYTTFYIGIIAIIVLLLVALFPIKGNYQIKIVKAGSMEPSIKTGSIVVIKPSSHYTVVDVITFDKDTNEIRQSDVNGRVLFDVPYFGYIIDLARKPLGFIFLIIIPTLIVVYDEVVKIVREVKKMRKKKEEIPVNTE